MGVGPALTIGGVGRQILRRHRSACLVWMGRGTRAARQMRPAISQEVIYKSSGAACSGVHFRCPSPTGHKDEARLSKWWRTGITRGEEGAVRISRRGQDIDHVIKYTDDQPGGRSVRPSDLSAWWMLSSALSLSSSPCHGPHLPIAPSCLSQ